MIRCAYLPESAWYVCVPPRISLVRLRTTQNQHGTHSVPYGLAFIAGGANKFACLLGYLVHKVLRPAGMANLAQNVRDGIANPAPLWGAIKSVAGVQGLPCDGASKQGKPCTPSVFSNAGRFVCITFNRTPKGSLNIQPMHFWVKIIRYLLCLIGL